MFQELGFWKKKRIRKFFGLCRAADVAVAEVVVAEVVVAEVVAAEVVVAEVVVADVVVAAEVVVIESQLLFNRSTLPTCCGGLQATLELERE